MNHKIENSHFVLRYVYAILAVAIASMAAVIGTIYAEQRSQDQIHDQIESFHLESFAELRELAREVRILKRLVQARIENTQSIEFGPAAIRTSQVSDGGILRSMGSRVVILSALHQQFGVVIYAETLDRLSRQISRIERTLRDSEPTTGTIADISVLSSTIEQFFRLHTIETQLALNELREIQQGKSLTLGLLVSGLIIGILAVWYLVRMLGFALARQRKAEQALIASRDRVHQMQKLDALGLLVGGVAHDFNNLLTTILGHAGLLQSEAAGDERFAFGLSQIEQAGEQAASLTQQLLAFSRRKQIELVVIDLNELLKNMEPMLRQLAGGDVSLVCDYAADLCAVELDPGQIRQVVMNLAVNARDAMPNGGVLQIKTESIRVGSGGAEFDAIPDGQYAKLTVADNGVGMDDDTRQRLFEPFFTTKDKGRGTGLGLSTAHSIITASNGHVFVESQVGKGSIFHVYLPGKTGHSAVSPEDDSPAAEAVGTETILIVEDEEQILTFLENGLASLGYRVLTASCGSEGIEICKSERDGIAVIVTDVIMPGMTGPEFLAEALQLCPDATSVYMSGYADDAELKRDISGVRIPLITKPFTLESLSRLIRKGLNEIDATRAPSAAS